MKPKLFIVWALFLLAACAKQSIVSSPQEETLYQLNGCFPQKLDSIIQVLDTLNVEALSEKERAHYCLLKVWTRDHLFLYDSVTDSLLQVAEDCFVGGKDKWFEALTCEALSRIAFKEGKSEQIKLDWLLKAFQSIEQCRHVDERLLRYSEKGLSEQEWIDNYRYKIQLRLGMCYLDNGYHKEGLRYLKPVYTYFSEKQKYNNRFYSTFMLGNAYLALKEYDSCLMCFEQGLEVARNIGQAENVAYYHLSMSMFYRYQFDNQDYENEEDGRQLLQKSISECHQGLALYQDPMFKYKDGLYSELENSYYRLGQYDSCAYYAEKQLDFMKAMHFETVPNQEQAIFLHLYKSYENLGNQEEALKYAHLYFETQQAIEKQPKAVEQVKNEYDKKIEMMQLQNEQQAKRYRLYLLLALVLLSLVVVVWLSNRYRKNKEIEILRQKEAYWKLESEFQSASQQSLQALQQRVMALYQSGQEDRLKRVLAEFVAAYPQGMEKLQANHPDLTDSERNIVILSFLGFRVKETADLLGLSINTVVKYRTNIRKKVDSKAFSDLVG